MKLDKRHKLEKAVVGPKAQGRDILRNPYIRVSDDGTAQVEATNSYILAIVPVELDPDDTAGILPVDAVKASRKARGHIAANGTVRSNGMQWDRPEGSYPDLTKLVDLGSYADSPTLIVNAKLLYELAQALGDDIVELTLHDDYNPVGGTRTESHRPIKVEPRHNTGNDARGVIMPARRPS